MSKPKNKRRKKAKPEDGEVKVSANNWRHGQPDTLLRDLVDQLTMRRIHLGYSQLDIDRIAGLQIGMTGKYECGDRSASGKFLAFWAKALRSRICIIPELGTAGPLIHRFDHQPKPTAPLE